MHEYFEEYIRAVNNPLPKMRDYFLKEIDYIKSLVSSDSVILDVGCGNGRMLKELAPAVGKATGIDYDAAMITEAKKNLRGIKKSELILGNFFEMEPAAVRDVVFASYNLLGSTEISTDRRDFLLAMMKRHAKPGGHVLASVWSDSGIDFAKEYYPAIGIKVIGIEKYDVITDHGSFKRFTKAELEELAKKVSHSFHIIDLSDIVYLLDINV